MLLQCGSPSYSKSQWILILSCQNRTDLGKCTHQCDEIVPVVQKRFQQKLSSSGARRCIYTTKEEASKEEDRRGADVQNCSSAPSPLSSLLPSSFVISLFVTHEEDNLFTIVSLDLYPIVSLCFVAFVSNFPWSVLFCQLHSLLSWQPNLAQQCCCA